MPRALSQNRYDHGSPSSYQYDDSPSPSKNCLRITNSSSPMVSLPSYCTFNFNTKKLHPSTIPLAKGNSTCEHLKEFSSSKECNSKICIALKPTYPPGNSLTSAW